MKTIIIYYKEDILSTILHGEKLIASSFCCTKYSGVFSPCDNQILRNRRLKQGDSGFGRMAIFKCTKRKETYTSKDVLVKTEVEESNIDTKPGSSPLCVDNLWSKTKERKSHDANTVHELEKKEKG